MAKGKVRISNVLAFLIFLTATVLSKTKYGQYEPKQKTGYEVEDVIEYTEKPKYKIKTVPKYTDHVEKYVRSVPKYKTTTTKNVEKYEAPEKSKYHQIITKKTKYGSAKSKYEPTERYSIETTKQT